MKSSGRPSVSYSLNASSPGHDPVAGRGALEHLLEPRQAGGQHRVEPLFFAADDAATIVSRFGLQLRIGVAHLATRTSTSAWRNGSVRPSFLPWRIARRMILRST